MYEMECDWVDKSEHQIIALSSQPKEQKKCHRILTAKSSSPVRLLINIA